MVGAGSSQAWTADSCRLVGGGAAEGNGMKQSSSTRWAIGTLAVVAIAISLDSLRRTRDDFDGARAAPRVVRRQLDAFNRDDYRAAYRVAAPEIQAQFPLAEFRRMVESGYPQIARSRS